MRRAVKTDKAPAAIGPYSQGIRVDCGSLIFVSGQIPLHPETGEIVGETVTEQTKQVMENIINVLAEAGVDFTTVAKTTIYLVDMEDFKEVNEVYATYFDEDPPARATIQVGRLPKDVKVEIDAIAVV